MEEFLAYLGRVLSIFDPREIKQAWDELGDQQKREILSAYTGNPVAKDLSAQTVSRLDARAGEIYSQLASNFPGLNLQNQPSIVVQQIYSEIRDGIKQGLTDSDLGTKIPVIASDIIEKAKKSPGLTQSPNSSPVNVDKLIERAGAELGWSSERVNNYVNASPDGALKLQEYLDEKAGIKSNRNAAQDAASYAAANAANVRAEIDRRNAEKAGTTFVGDDGVTYTWLPNGDFKQTAGITAADRAQIKVAQDRVQEESRHNKVTEGTDAGRLQLDTTRAGYERDYQQGQLGIGQEGNRLRGVEVGNSATFQKGQLQQGLQRLALDTSVASAAAAAKTQENDLARQQYISKVLASPSDFIARAFMQRGEGSPTARITQADLINQINEQFNNNPTAFVAPKNVASPSAVPELPQYAQGTAYGYVNDKAAIVGDPQADGGPNPEMIHNPTGAPIAVVPLKGSNGEAPQRLAQGTEGRLGAGEGKEPVNEEQKKADAIGKVIPLIEDEDTAHRLVSEMHAHRGRLKAYANGTGVDLSQGWTNPDTGAKYTIDNGNVVTTPAPAAPATSTGDWRENAEGWGKDPDGTWRFTGALGGAGTGTSVAGTPRLSPTAPTATKGYGNITLNTDTLPSFQDILDQMKTALRPTAPRLAPVSQEQLLSMADRNLPPAARALFNTSGRLGQAEVNKNPLGNQSVQPLSFGFNIFSPEALSQLTPAELQSLDSYLGVKYNTTLEDVVTGMKQLYGKPTTRTGRLAYA